LLLKLKGKKMTNGVLGARSLSAGISQNIYVNNFSDMAMVTINICNLNHVETKISIALSLNGHASLLNSEWIEFQTTIPGKGNLLRTGVAVSPGHYIVVKSSESNVSAQVWGIEVGSSIGSVGITANTSGDGPTFVGPSTFTVIAGDSS
jgi:hypothetical protein